MKDFLKFPKKNFLIILFLLGFGEWFVSDVIDFSGGFLGFIVLCLFGYLYLKKDVPKFEEPKDLIGWVDLCKQDLKFFDELEKKNNIRRRNSARTTRFDEVLQDISRQRITLLNSKSEIEFNNLLDQYLRSGEYDLITVKNMPTYNLNNEAPLDWLKSEAILYNLELPLSAKDLLWLQKIPEDMPIWLVTLSSEYKNNFDDLKSQIPKRFINKIMNVDTHNNSFKNIPISFRKFGFRPKQNIDNTKKRLLKDLHIKWQEEIEVIRRLKLKEIQNKNQLLVAATVFASPVPSVDVLSMTVLNTLMIKEIKSLWGCEWSPEMIESVSKQIIKTALAQGVVEWSSRALLNLTKLHGPNWIIAGTFQAVSAAYLTRVVSRSLADFMAISKGISEPSLDFIKNNTDKIVADSFESEKINWMSIFPDLKFRFN
tara:strand:+ start:1957 stop:3237 length:1281 start_codon:yes stop_codon:yes gene_type:complete